MALFIIANSGKISYGIKHYLCDTLDDIPFEDNGEAIAPGSTVYVIDSKKTYMYNSKGQWVEIITGGGSGGVSALSGLTDVNLSQLKDGEYLVYDVESGMWKNGTGKDIYAELQGILTAGETTVTLTSDYITANSVIEDYVDDAFDGVEYISREVTDGSVTYTFPEQESDMPVMARVWIKGVGAANSAQTDINGRDLTSYVGGVTVDATDNSVINIVDGEGNAVNNIGLNKTTGTASEVTDVGTAPALVITGDTISLDPGTVPTVTPVTVVEDISFSEV